jgi:hypothetical protein
MERAPTPSPSNVFTFGFIVESIKELGGASSMSFSGGRISLPHQPNKAFTRGCVFEHIASLAHPLLSYQKPKWKNVLSL